MARRNRLKRRTFLAGTAGLAGLVAGCSDTPNQALPSEARGEWLQQSHDHNNTGTSAVAVPGRGNPAWDAGDAGSIEPLVADGMVYSVGDSVTALDAKTGEQEWEFDASSQTGPTPALTKRHLLVPAGSHIVALDRDAGDEQWSISLPRPAERALTVESQVVTVPIVARRGEPSLVAYDAATGDRIWDNPTVAARTTAIDGDRVYVTGYLQDGDTAILRALSPADGTKLWEIELDHPDTAPVVGDDVLLVPDQGTLAVHDPTDGSRLRSLGRFGDRIRSPPAVADGVAYVGTREQEVVALSVEDGSTVWRQSGSASRGLSVGRETVVISGESLPDTSLAGVAALDRSSGTVRWEHQIEGFDAFPSTAPVLAEGAVYYTSNASRGVVALGDVSDDGEE